MEIPGYGELEQLHRGHRYLVFRARRASDGRTVILKTVPPVGRRPEDILGLRREHALLETLDGISGVVRVLALEGTAVAPRLVLADAGPLSLDDWLKRRRLDVSAFLPLAIRMAEILDVIHGRNLVHRDINPCNVVLDAAGQVPTLIDFDSATSSAGQPDGDPRAGLTPVTEAGGSAASEPSQESEGSEESIVGTLAYLAPEQTGRLNRTVDHRADLYGLGVTFYEMLTGSRPFTSPDPVELVHAHLARPPVPPVTLDAKVPALLSDVVMKLLAKMPEQRYQQASTLVADLRQAQAAWQAHGRIDPFPLGRGDLAHILPIPDKLYGRQDELDALTAAWQRAGTGPSELLVVSGPAGSGKSTLVHALVTREDLGPGRAGFIWGKFEPFRGDTPYASLVEALRRLGRGWLDGPAAARENWRLLLLETLGRNVRVMSDLIPELRAVVGEAPAVPELGPVESERRFHLTFSSFVRVVAGRLRPLVLLIDDAQWADPASLKLLGLLATDPDIRHLLLVVTFRTEELAEGHLLTRTLDEIRSSGGTVAHVPLPPLDDAAVTQLCTDTLHGDPEALAQLGRQVRGKTGGNAFFVRRFLLHLHQEGLLLWSGEHGRWEWDAAAVERAEVTENVLGLMLEAIRRLPLESQRLLEKAACFRRRSDLRLLAALAGTSLDQVATNLWGAIGEGLLVPDDLGPPGPGQPASVGYRFAHDRVQQAAYSLLDESERCQIHLALARLLLRDMDQVGPAVPAEVLFEVLDQLRPAVHLVTEPAERLRLAQLALSAGNRAQASSAYGQAFAYLQVGLQLFPPEARTSQRGLLFQLHRQAFQLAQLTGDQDQTRQLGQAAFALATTPLEVAELHNIDLVACSMRGAYPEAIAQGRKALAVLGLELPSDGAPPASESEFTGVEARMVGRQPQDLLALPRMHDPWQLARMQLLSNLLDPAYVCDPALLAVLVERMVELSLRHGNSVHSAFAYTVYAMIMVTRHASLATAHALGRAGVDLARAFGDPVQECRTLHIFGAFVNHWREPVASSVPRLRLAVTRALESGDLHYGVYADYTAVTASHHRGVELGQVIADLENAFALTRKIRVNASVPYLLACRQTVRCLQGRTRAHGLFDDEHFDEQAHLASCGNNPIALWIYLVLRLETTCLLGDPDSALDWSRRAGPLRPVVGPLTSVVDHNFYTSLAVIAAALRTDGALSPEQRTAMLAEVSENQKQLGVWAESCPENFRHKHLLVAAEVCRLSGKDREAAELYDQAIDAAQREGFLRDVALGSELAGRFHRALGRRRIADFYLRAAIEAFSRWGAVEKVATLEEEFPHLAELAWRAPLPTVGADGKALDLLSLLKAAGTISSEVELERLIVRLLAICFEVGGADRGALLLEEEGGLVVRAIGSVSGVPALDGTPLSQSTQVPRTLIEFAHRNAEPVVLGDPARQGPFVGDPYLRTHKVKSALALPIRHHARSLGVLYLENNLAAQAFNAPRLKVLNLLSSQMAISLENSLLFGKLSREIEERKRAETKAQDSVRSRDEFLSIASHELKTPITSLSLALQVLAQETRRSGTGRMPQLTDVAERQVRRLQSLIDDLLDVSRIRSGRLTLTCEQVELGALVREVMEGFASQSGEARCQLIVRAPAPIMGHWSRARLEQVVVDLIANALKFGRGKPVEIDLIESHGQVSLTITDHGIGIAPDRLPFIFERFERAVSTSHYGGLGLGLYIAREIVSAMGGTIQARSRLGQGSTFVVTLPLVAEREHPSTLFEHSPDRPS